MVAMAYAGSVSSKWKERCRLVPEDVIVVAGWYPGVLEGSIYGVRRRLSRARRRAMSLCEHGKLVG